jgi:dTDP-4-dehydrorhamnose 3,5-epimerase
VNTTSLAIPGVYLIETTPFSDSRGVSAAFELESVIDGLPFHLARWYTSFSEIGVVRGIHLANQARNQYKLISCVHGNVFDIVIDLRRESETFLQKLTLELRGNDGKVLLIPPGVGHGYQALQHATIMSYLISDSYEPASEITLDPLSPEIGIEWPLTQSAISERDKTGLKLHEFVADLEK